MENTSPKNYPLNKLLQHCFFKYFPIVILIVVLRFSCSDLLAQEINYYEHISPILEQHCTTCHHNNDITPFSLTGYEDAAKRANLIKNVTQHKIMPPWPADTAYCSFLNQNILSEKEIELLKMWAEQGAREGRKIHRMTDSHPMNLSEKPDYVLKMPEEYNVKGVNKDEFRRFHIPSTINEDINVSAFEFIPGNKKRVHHTEFFVDSNASLKIDFSNDTSYIIPGDKYSNEGTPDNLLYNYYYYVTGWLPGLFYESYPLGSAVRIKRNSTFMFLVHYSPSPKDETDLSKLYIYKSKQKVERYVDVIALHANSDMVNGPLFIPADTVMTFHSRKILEQDYSAFSILAHAHHLAKKMLAYAVTPAQDTIPLLRINNWNFNWQFNYKYPKYIKLEKGTEINFFATYDNTANNPENPYHPPQNIKSSFNVNDEMMELFIFTLLYKNNDENTNIVFPYLEED